EELFCRQAEGVLLVYWRHVIEAVEIRDRLQVSFVLDQLLGTPVQEADMRIDTSHNLAVQFEHKAQHAVRGRVLWAEIDREITQPSFAHGAVWLLRVKRPDSALVPAGRAGNTALHAVSRPYSSRSSQLDLLQVLCRQARKNRVPVGRRLTG